ncbi:HtaA domain-containing protein [Streptomyces sp. NPDC017941]|uniref:HtaA domain-containing protein n=1 Tax=Streptomyces sp. NPDC017941 TaxID=3365018 RepID=UPI003798D87E
MAATRRPIARAAAVATAAVLGAAALALPAVADTPVDTPAEGAAGAPRAPKAFTLKDGTLDWGLKESFRKYVTGMAHGKIKAGGGAEQAPGNGVFTFTGGKGTYEMTGHVMKAAFKGDVRFTSALHKFDIKIADVRVHTKGRTGAIQADVTLNGAEQNDIDLAALDLSGVTPGQGPGGTMTFKDIPATLTAKGAKAFNGMYQKGQALDPATLTVRNAGPAPSPDPTPSKPGKPSEPGKPGKPSPKPSDKPAPKPTKPTPTPKPTSGTGGSGGRAPSGEVVGGKLSWGLKESFRRYISAGGGVEAAGGARKTSAGYDFPYAKATWDARAKKVNASFKGSVRFRYQGHGIDMRFSDFKVRASGTKGTLSVDVRTPAGTTDDVQFATLDLSGVPYAAKGDVVQLRKVPARLTAAGAEQFESEEMGSVYKEGEKLDPLTVALTLSEDAEIPPSGGGAGASGQAGGGSGDAAAGGGSVGGGSVGGGSVGGAGSLAATGSGTPSGALLGVAGAVVVAGAGAVYAARRRPLRPRGHA